MEGKFMWFSFLLCKTAFHKNPFRASVRGWAFRCVCVGVGVYFCVCVCLVCLCLTLWLPVCVCASTPISFFIAFLLSLSVSLPP